MRRVRMTPPMSRDDRDAQDRMTDLARMFLDGKHERLAGELPSLKLHEAVCIDQLISWALAETGQLDVHTKHAFQAWLRKRGY